ncbi:DNA adenine methylase [Weissella hellenica]|uniref:DNA adenine methylase n=1 Tax=Weissella hellenica TaxID=46256 RepID=UPI00388553DC
MILETYLKNNNKNLHQMHLETAIPETTLRNINQREIDKWNIKYFDALAKTVGKEKLAVITELENLSKQTISGTNHKNYLGRYNLENRRYIGNKSRLVNWIAELINTNTSGNSFLDLFAGTGVVSKKMMPKYDSIILNDFLYSNNIIYNAFFGTSPYDIEKILNYQDAFKRITSNTIDDDYFVTNYGNKFFSDHDARIIGEIRTRIEKNKKLNNRERSILIASLIYSVDKIANTVGHYDAYRKKVEIKDKFVFELINPLNVDGKNIKIYRKNANDLVKQIKSDVVFIDPPYNSRQYSRFYHVLEGIAKWDKPHLTGVAMKPPVENMSDYSKVSAHQAFDDLITHINAKYIVVTYNNTYNSKSNSSKNKITHEQILESLNKVGHTKSFEMPFQFFNAGKTELKDHKEFVFITEVIK